MEGRVWKASVILLSNGSKIEAIGSGKKIRGRRHKQWSHSSVCSAQLMTPWYLWVS